MNKNRIRTVLKNEGFSFYFKNSSVVIDGDGKEALEIKIGPASTKKLVYCIEQNIDYEIGIAKNEGAPCKTGRIHIL